MVLKIYGHPLSTYTQKSLIVLAATETPYDFVFFDLLKGEHKGSDYTAKDPFGSVPCIVRLASETYGISRAN
jgi:glutathione S-transferase